MNSVSTPLRPSPLLHRSRWSTVLVVVLTTLAGASALATVAYLLWPTWRATSPDDPARLPITVGSALFNVPAKAIRVRMQRRAGPQERIDLAFAWPSLLPPEPQGHLTAESVEDRPVPIDRIFLSIARGDDARHVHERAPCRRRAPDVPLPKKLAVRLARRRHVDGHDRQPAAEQGELTPLLRQALRCSQPLRCRTMRSEPLSPASATKARSANENPSAE
jgi:hypothetical protein